jgi:hypothetical protein
MRDNLLAVRQNRGGNPGHPQGANRRSDAENVGQDARRMLARIDALVHAFDPALLVNEKTHACWMPRVKIRTRAVRESCRALAIAKQRKFEAKLLGESAVLLGRVETRAEHLDPVLVVVLLMVAEPASLERSAGRVGLGVKPKQHLSAS